MQNRLNNINNFFCLVCPVQHLDLIFLVDGSGSVNMAHPDNFDRIKAWIKSVTARFNLRFFAQVGVTQFSHYYADL